MKTLKTRIKDFCPSLLIASVPIHLGLLALFFFLILLSTQTQATLCELGVGFQIDSTVREAFQRYGFFLVIAAVVSLIRTGIDARLTDKAEKKEIFLVISAVFASLLFFTVLIGVLQFPMCGDDSFIDFRYVKNWVNHTSFDYNPGEAVLGFTSYVHVGILTLLSFLLPLIDLPLLSQLTNVSFQLLNCCIIYFFLLDLSGNRWSALSGAAVYTLDPFSVQQSTFGKEAPILLFVLTLSLWAILRRKHQALAWLSCLIPFIRPEGAIFSSICLAWSLKDNGPKVLKLWIAPILIAASFTFLVFSYFGTIVPHGMIGKLKMFYPSSYPKIFFMALWMMGTGLFIPRFYIDRPGLYYGLGSVLFGFILLSIFIYVARGHVHRIYALSLVAYLLIFLGKNPEAFSWYLVWFALFPVFFVSILVSLLLELKDKSRLSMILCLVLLADIFLVQIAQQVKRPSPGLASLTFSWSPELDRLIKFEKALECIYKEPGGRTATLATLEIGYIGYLHKGAILDLAGLLSPSVIKYGHPPLSLNQHNKPLDINPQIIKDLKPKYVISLELFCQLLMKEEFFKREYKELCFFTNRWAGTNGIYVFKRVESKSSLLQ